jgi:uncharacterized delta-60 repeat protein
MHRRPAERSTPAAVLALLTLALSGAGTPAFSQSDGELDASFWGDGRVTLASPPYWRVDTVVTAPDGRLVIVGARDPFLFDDLLFWATLGDASLGPVCVPEAAGGSTSLHARAAAFDDQGRLVIVGFGGFPPAGGQGFAMRFLYPACDLDETFNTDGVYRTDLVNADLVAVGFDSGGRVLLAGTAEDAGGDDMLEVIRLGQGGLLDWSFADFGRFELDLPEPLTGTALAVQADDRIVVGAVRSPDELLFGDFFFVRLDTDGELDGSFAAGGTLQVDLQGDHYDYLHDLVIDPVGGAILAAGSSGTSASHEFAVLRLTPGGAVDETFADDGLWTGGLLDTDTASAIELQSDGKILVAGTVSDADTAVADFAVFRLLPSGEPDGSFGILGASRVSFDHGAIEFDELHAIALQAGRLVAVGAAWDWDGVGSRAVVARLWSDLVFTDGFERASTGAWSSAFGAP